MTKILKTTDNARTTLAAGISAAATSIALNTGLGAQLPQAKFGTASSAGTSTVLNDTGDLAFLVVGDIIANHTDGSWAVVTIIGTNSVTTTPLIGGSDNTWQNSDEWRYNEFVSTLTNETVNGNGTITTNKREKILVKSVTVDTLTVTRGYDGSTAQTFSTNDYCNLFSTTAINEGIRQAISDIKREVASEVASVDVNIDSLVNSQPMHASCTNTGNAYTLTCNAIVDAYITGLQISFSPSAANTGAATVNVNGLGVKNIYKNYDKNIDSDDLKVGYLAVLRYNGVNFELHSFAQQQGSTKLTQYIKSSSFSTLRNQSSAGTYDAVISLSEYQSSIPANTLSVGDVFMLHLSARAFVNLTSAVFRSAQAKVDLRIGASNILTIGADLNGSTIGECNVITGISAIAIVNSIGASGSIVVYPTASLASLIGTGSTTNITGINHVTITLNTTVSNNIRVNEFLTVSSSSCSATLHVYSAAMVRMSGFSL